MDNRAGRARAILLATTAIALLTVMRSTSFAAGPGAAGGQTANTTRSPAAIETVIVTGQRYRYREQALKAKAAAPNVIEVQPVQEIRKLPDVNVAEALQRMPGISMESDSGQGRFVNIRGMDADLNGTTFDGVRLTPSNQATPQGGGRAVAFDAFPTGIIGSVEIIKSLTPDIDAEGLGGVINLQPRGQTQSGEPFLDAGLGSGWEPLRGTPVWQGDVTAGTTLDADGDIGHSGPFGLVGSYAYDEDHRGVDDVEEAYFNNPPHKTFDNVGYRWYEYHRIRQGIGGEFTFAPDDSNTFYVRAIHAGYVEYALKHIFALNHLGDCPVPPKQQCVISGPGLGDFTARGVAVPSQSLTDDEEHVGNNLVMVGGHSIIGSLVNADYRAAWTRGYDNFPRGWGASFAAASPLSKLVYNNANPVYPTYSTSVDLTNPSLYQLSNSNTDSQLQNATSKSFDQEWSSAADFSFPLVFDDDDGVVKFGASVRLRQRGVSLNQRTYVPTPATDPVSLAGLTRGPDIIYYDNHYNIGPHLNEPAIESLPVVLQDVLNGTNNDYLADGQSFEHDNENVFAGYAQYSATIGLLGVIGGVRFEATDGTYRANLATTDINGNTTLTPNVNKQSYTDFFPSLQAKYSLDDQTQLRAAFSSAIARPGFNQITAAKTFDRSSYPDITITQGNPSLKPTTGDSFDLAAEHYMPNGGVAAVGLFYKYFENYIIPTSNRAANGNTGTTTTNSFANIGTAFAEGAELNYIQQFAFLPDPLDGMGFDGNITFVYAKGDIRSNPIDHTTLPQTSPFNYNAELFYEKGPLGIRLAASYVSRNIFTVGSDWTQDVYSRERFRLDLGATYDVSDNMQFYFNAKNLTNTLLEFTQTKSSYFPIQREFYGPTYFAGIRVQLGQGGFGHLTAGDDD